LQLRKALPQLLARTEGFSRANGLTNSKSTGLKREENLSRLGRGASGTHLRLCWLESPAEGEERVVSFAFSGTIEANGLGGRAALWLRLLGLVRDCVCLIGGKISVALNRVRVRYALAGRALMPYSRWKGAERRTLGTGDLATGSPSSVGKRWPSFERQGFKAHV